MNRQDWHFEYFSLTDFAWDTAHAQVFSTCIHTGPVSVYTTENKHKTRNLASGSGHLECKSGSGHLGCKNDKMTPSPLLVLYAKQCETGKLLFTIASRSIRYEILEAGSCRDNFKLRCVFGQMRAIGICRQSFRTETVKLLAKNS